MPNKTPADNAVIPFMGGKCDLASIHLFEKFLLTHPDADTSGGDVESFFSEGLYTRKLTIPADTFIVGEMHLKGNINFLMKGTITVSSADGNETLHAPNIIVSKPGVKRAVHALTETVWVTVSATDKTTVEEVKTDIIATDLSDPRLEGILCLGES